MEFAAWALGALLGHAIGLVLGYRLGLLHQADDRRNRAFLWRVGRPRSHRSRRSRHA